MAQPACRISFLSSFADFVRQQRDAIDRTWMQLVRESPDVPGKRSVDLISDALPFGRLWYAEPEAIANAIGYAKFARRL
jgi:hypothetical protein